MVTWEWNGYQNKKSALEVDPGKEHSPAAPAGNRTRDLSLRSPALYRLPIMFNLSMQSYMSCENRQRSEMDIKSVLDNGVLTL